jgi:hypothetical protein
MMKRSRRRSVNSIVDIRIDNVVPPLYLVSQKRGREVQLGEFGNLIEIGIQYVDDISAFVINNIISQRIPQHGNRGPAIVATPSFSASVDLFQSFCILFALSTVGRRCPAVEELEMELQVETENSQGPLRLGEATETLTASTRPLSALTISVR